LEGVIVEFFLVLLTILFILFFYFRYLSSSIFGIQPGRGYYPGIFFFYNFLIFIIPSSFLLNIYPIEHFWVAFKVEQELIFFITMLVLISYLILLVCLFVLVKSLPRFFNFTSPVLTSTQKAVYRRFVYYALFTSLALVVASWVFLGVGHAFILSIVFDEGLSQTRFTISKNLLTKFLKYYFIIISPLLMAVVASPVFESRRLERIIVILGIVFIASWSGIKGPILKLPLIYFFVWATFSGFKVGLKNIFKGLLFIFILMYLVYQVVIVQYTHLKELDLFFDYFYQRVFVAQMTGIYEQFSLNIHDIAYFWHGVPFASFFVDYPIFHKDLMMISEDHTDLSSIGIKNTYFVAEAYAMGGFAFILPAILIYAFNFAISYIIFVIALNKFLSANIEFNKLIAAIFLFSYLSVTGGFSDLMLLKIMIMLFILLSPIFAIAYISRFRFVLRKI
jgi:hypothetical protein